jgi:hypothetical protein
LVAKIDAPITGQLMVLPPRKKLALFRPAFLRYAIYKPKARLPPITIRRTIQSSIESERFISG